MVENRASENIMENIESIIKEIGEPPDKVKFEDNKDRLVGLVDKLSEIEKHYLRKENQLFPVLEAKGVSGPSQVMWAIHDDVRNAIKELKSQISKGNLRLVTSLADLIATIRDMIYKEEKILYPMSLETLTPEEWLKVKKGEKEIGYSWIKPLVDWTPEIKPSRTNIGDVSEAGEQKVELDVGSLTSDQVNLLLTNIPFDVTFVDENDRVAYYSQGKERRGPHPDSIFPGKVRSQARNASSPFVSGRKETAQEA